ncbi:MAG: ferrous iron transport protein A [Phycisphaerae bacterium]
MKKRTLPSLTTGEAGTIERVLAVQQAAKRLADMGFVCGARLEMVRPGAPCIVRIDGVCIGLGRRHQDSVLLRSA